MSIRKTVIRDVKGGAETGSVGLRRWGPQMRQRK
jgi:hypothetical protein